ncbi:MAG: glutamine--tRNA ligase/YqeY domain fusion protein, partial [Caldilineaceae bacterium]|nr:glutamine--tRNA ligase/YqeY domain fusion protein [Caldilineaceae bacterium]
NMKMRDPLLYRIRHASHYRTGDEWPIYPMYDFAHPLSDAIEGITHSICTLEFENNREIYDWLGNNLLEEPRPHQYEFARLNLNNTVLSKRKLRRLVEEKFVAGWDDPRMPTIAGIQRRGVTPAALRDFCERIGVAKTNSRIDPALLDACIRDDLNMTAPRVMAVLNPLKVVVTNYPESQVEAVEASFWPRDVPKEGSRPVPFTRELYIEQDDFAEQPPKGFRRLVPGGEVRLRYAYIIKCEAVVKDDAGTIVELHCTYDPDSKGGAPKDGRKVQGTVHWVSATQGVPAEVRLYDRLFTLENPDDIDDEHSFTDFVNPASLVVVQGVVEPSLAQAQPWERFQFERQGYFMIDPVDSRPEALVFNRTVELRDSWTKSTTMPSTADVRQSSAAPATQVLAGPAEDSTRKSKTELRAERRAQEPELVARLARYQEDFGLSFEDADVLTGDLALAQFYEAALAVHDQPQSVANWVLNEVLREVKEGSLESLPFDAAALAKLVALVDNNTISTAAAKDVFAEMMRSGGDPVAIVEKKGLQQISDAGALTPLIAQVIAANAAKAEEYRSGKTGLLGFFIGQVMRETKGKANPQLVQELVQKQLG